MSNGGITWSGTLPANLAGLNDRMRRGIKAAAQYTAADAEAYMRANAPWTDRTGAARNGLGAKVQGSGDEVAVILYHSVFYGPYLEARWGGKYAIIGPTLDHSARVFVEAIGKLGFK